MKKLDYLVYALKKKLYLDRVWVFRCFSIPYLNKELTETLPGYNRDEGITVMVDGVKERIDDWKEGEILFPLKERFILNKGAMSCVIEDVQTNYGEVIINAMIFEFGAEGKIPYQPGLLKKKLASIVGPAYASGQIETEDYFRIVKGINQVELFTSLHVTTHTDRALTPSPDVIALKNELVEKYKDRLTEPAIAAIIEEAVAKADKEYMAGDPSAKFLLKDKAYGVIRKELLYLQGGIPRLDDPSKVDFISGSLIDGYKPEDLPAIINQLRSGSYDRGASTALGGEAAKFSNRVFQNTKIAEPDCGTRVGKRELIDGGWRLTGRYLVGEDEPLTQQRVDGLKGKVVYMRDPTACKTKNGNYCGKCVGRNLSESKIGLGPMMAEICNVFLSISLAAFHGTAPKTTLYDYLSEIK